MSRKVLTQSCVIQCSHGGTVAHPSSDPIRVIGGLKPNFCVDILGASISGCPKKKPCTVVAGISSAMTETNVNGTSGTYALDVAGCKTNKGAALVIAGRANKNSFSLPPSGIDNVVGADASESEKEKALEKKEDEKYNLYLVRESKDFFLDNIYKPLRACRGFNKIEDYYGTMDTHPQIKEKIVTYTLAFVYIKLSTKKIEEYKIISKGSLFAETIKEIKYKDENNVEHDYIPLYNGEEIEIFYTNVQVRANQTKRAEDLGLFKGIKFDPTVPSKNSKESFFIDNVSSINSNEIDLDMVKNAKEFEPKKAHALKIKDAKAKGTSTDFTMYPLNVVMTLDDSLGKAEDMFNHYEFRFKSAYSFNDERINKIKKKNAYVYSVANQVDYFYVSKEEQKEYDENLNKLKKLYIKLADSVCEGKLSSIIIKDEDNIENLDDVINDDFDTALNYYNQTQYINKTFFKNVLSSQSRKERRDRKVYNEDEFRIINPPLVCEYKGVKTFVSLKRQNGFKRNRYKQKLKEYSDVNYGYLVIADETDKKYKEYQQNPCSMLALLVFSICFGKRYENEVKSAGLEQTVNEFYYALKTTHPLPSIGDDNIKDIRTIVQKQDNSYAKISSGENKLLSQYESLDVTNKEMSFDFDEAKKNSPKDIFSDLYLDKDFTEFFYDAQTNSKVFLEEAKKLIEHKDFKDTLLSYKSLKEFDKEKELEYFNIMTGILHTFTYNRSKLDTEGNINSPFQSEKKHILDMAKELINRRKELEEDFNESIFNLPISIHYRYNLHSHLVHSMANKGRNQKGFGSRQTNANAFLNEYASNKEKYVLDRSNLLASDFDISQESQKMISKLNSAILTIEGYGSKVLSVIDETEKLNGVNNPNNNIDSGEDVNIKKDRSIKLNLEKYKTFLSSSKTLATFIVGANVATSLINWKSLKSKDIFPLIGDMYTTLEAFGKSLPKTKESVIKATQTVLSAENYAKAVSWKIMSKVGLAAVAISAIYDITRLEDSDYDGAVAIIAKNTIVLSLLLIPGIGWVSAVGILVVELAWQFLVKDIFIDTPLESYIFKSLLFNKTDDKDMLEAFFTTFAQSTFAGYAIYRYYNKKPFSSPLLIESIPIDSSLKTEGFDTYEELQTFIGDNYDENTELFDNAMQFELQSLKTVALGYQINIEDNVEEVIGTNGYDVVQELQTRIKIPKEIMRNNIQVMLRRDNEYQSIHISEETALGEVPIMPKDFKHNILSRNNVLKDGKIISSSKINWDDAKKLKNKTIHLFIINRDIALKYKVSLDINFLEADVESMMSDKLIIEIDKITLDMQDEQERNMLDNIIYSRRISEEQLAKKNKDKKSA